MNEIAPTITARRMETINVGSIGHEVPPTHWPPRINRMCLAVRLGITRWLLEARA